MMAVVVVSPLLWKVVVLVISALITLVGEGVLVEIEVGEVEVDCVVEMLVITVPEVRDICSEELVAP